MSNLEALCTASPSAEGGPCAQRPAVERTASRSAEVSRALPARERRP
ncbi:hypothetical protein [Lysobacter solisilvae (ex Woo and Kim 2020)]|uniref:Uncharacterized protein n=1 Tax=Agrilutibacter terrestris TaxID=2865112 RepID=A0A7H0FXE8_9GAMM|nr:hypothetical protein [Lysobacter terrestris]QNP40714.1 hypothetical protein H8B22_00130 [Lysobacter terrestris]